MGYRHYFYTADLAECDHVENMDYNMLALYCKERFPGSSDDDTYIDIHEILGQREVFEFGKLYYDDTAERIYRRGRPLFSNKETQGEFSYYKPYRMGKEGMMEAIEIYKQKIISYYECLLVDGEVQVLPLGIEIPRNDIKSVDKLVKNAKDALMWWKEIGAIDLNENHEAIAKSWLYEHQIFELVRLYKTIDWDKKCLLFYGW
jgi:hypothetical protein